MCVFRVPQLHPTTSNLLEKKPEQIPTTSFQFETTFKKLRNNTEDLYNYLKASKV